MSSSLPRVVTPSRHRVVLRDTIGTGARCTPQVARGSIGRGRTRRDRQPSAGSTGSTNMTRFSHNLLLVMVAALPGLPDDRAKSGDPIAGLPVQEGWRPSAENPCLSFGQLRTLASWNDPCVLKWEGRYVMYLTSSLMIPRRPPVQPFRAVSDDGLRWTLEPKTPLIEPGKDASDFDAEF